MMLLCTCKVLMRNWKLKTWLYFSICVLWIRVKWREKKIDLLIFFLSQMLLYCDKKPTSTNKLCWTLISRQWCYFLNHQLHKTQRGLDVNNEIIHNRTNELMSRSENNCMSINNVPRSKVDAILEVCQSSPPQSTIFE